MTTKIGHLFILTTVTLLLFGCTQKTSTLSYEPNGSDQLIPTMTGYEKVDLEQDAGVLATVSTGAVTAYFSGGEPNTVRLVTKSMKSFTDCLIKNKAGSVKAFYSVEKKAIAVIGVGEADAKKILACAIKIGAPGSIASRSVSGCQAVYTTKSPSGKEYYVGILGLDQEGGAVCRNLCVASINGCTNVESQIIANY